MLAMFQGRPVTADGLWPCRLCAGLPLLIHVHRNGQFDSELSANRKAGVQHRIRRLARFRCA